MKNILVSGLLTLETTLTIERFPLDYFPVCFPFNGIGTTLSGVAYNVAKALRALGTPARICAVLGKDSLADFALGWMERDGLSAGHVLRLAGATSQSVIINDPSGRRQIHCDLKDIQDCEYPLHQFTSALEGASMVVAGTLNMNRPLVRRAKASGIPVAVDFHVLRDLEDPYHLDFLETASIAFFSHEGLDCSPADWAARAHGRWGFSHVVIGCGPDGAWLSDPGAGISTMIPAMTPRPVVNTIGAGDALFSCFVHEMGCHGNSRKALERAVLFAGWKIGQAGAAEGFPDQALWQDLVTAAGL